MAVTTAQSLARPPDPADHGAEGPLFTAEEFLTMPLAEGHHELLDGRVHSMPPAGTEHGEVGANMLGPMWQHVHASGTGRALAADTGFVLRRDPDCVRVPDVAFISAGRLPDGESPTGFFEGAPDLAVEVVSPSERTQDTEAKVRDYLAAGTRLVWVIYPALRSARVWRKDGTTEAVDEAGVLSGEDVVPGFALELSRVLP